MDVMKTMKARHKRRDCNSFLETRPMMIKRKRFWRIMRGYSRKLMTG